MNCAFCNEHILATTSIAWNMKEYHPDCIGEAVASYRALQERVNNGLSPSDYEAFEDEEPFEDEYYQDDGFEDIVRRLDEGEGYDFQSDTIRTPLSADLDELEEIGELAELENLPEVSDEVLNEIPVIAGNGSVRLPEVSQPSLVATSSRPVGTLISGITTTLINRDALKFLPVPETTDTFKPIPHFELVDNIMKSLSYRRLEVVREEYAVSFDGMKMFGLIELNVEYSGVRFAIGLRNSNDKSMRVGLVAGYRVMVCENKMLTGDFQPMLAKHSKNFNLIDGLSVAIDRIQRNIGRVNDEIEIKKLTMLSYQEASSLIYQAFLEKKLPMSLMRAVHKEFFVAPSYDEFREKSLWSMENAFTSSFKKLKPVAQFEATARLGKFITSHITPF
jgi:hypothetical protein